jgi:hypothetical protein
MRSKRSIMTYKTSRRKIQQGGAIEQINSVEHLDTLLDKKEITAVQVVFNRNYKDFTDAQTNKDTFKLLRAYLTNKKKYNVSKIYNINVLEQPQSSISQEKTFFEKIQDLIPFTQPTTIPPLRYTEIKNLDMLEVLRKIKELEQVRVEFENYASYGDIDTNKITQIVIRNYLKNKRDANIEEILYM